MSYYDEVMKIHPLSAQVRAKSAEIAARADARIAELECGLNHLSAAFDADQLRIAELEQSVTVRDTEIARLETDLELARRDAERWRKLRAMNWTQKDALAVVHVRDLRLGTLTFTHDRLDLAVDARAGNGVGCERPSITR